MKRKDSKTNDTSDSETEVQLSKQVSNQNNKIVNGLDNNAQYVTIQTASQNINNKIEASNYNLKKLASLESENLNDPSIQNSMAEFNIEEIAKIRFKQEKNESLSSEEKSLIISFDQRETKLIANIEKDQLNISKDINSNLNIISFSLFPFFPFSLA
jgi:hypothetical protein